MTTVTPPSLSYFCIFNPTFAYSDDTLSDQIFFYTSRADSVSADEQLRRVGLIQGIISFASDFSNHKPVEIIDTKKTRTAIVEIEPNWWIVLCVTFTRIQTPISSSSSLSRKDSNGNNTGAGTTNAKNSKSNGTSSANGSIKGAPTPGSVSPTDAQANARVNILTSFRRRKKVEYRTDYSRKEVPGSNILHSQLIRGYNQWKLMYGTMPDSYVRDEAAEKAAKEQRRRAAAAAEASEAAAVPAAEAETVGESSEASTSTPSARDDIDPSQPPTPPEEYFEPPSELAQFRINLRKFWSWWLHKWELYIVASATWGGTLNNSFLAHNLVLGLVPTLSFSFMDYANGIKLGGPGQISDLTSEAIRAIIKREERNGMVDLIITRMNSFSVTAPGGSIIRSGNPAAFASDSASLLGADTESIYSAKDDAASIMSSRSLRSRYFEKEAVAASEYDSDSDDGTLTSEQAEEQALQEERRNGCIFQGTGFMSRTSVAEYSRWIIDNHIFPSPSVIEGVKWSLYANKEDPMWLFSELVFSFKYGFRRPQPKKRKSGNKKRGKMLAIISNSDSSSTNNSNTAAVAASNGNGSAASKHLSEFLSAKHALDNSLGLLSKVASSSTATTSTTTGNIVYNEKFREIKDDLSEAKFMVGLQGELDMDSFGDDDEDDEGGGDVPRQPEITTRDVFVLRKRKRVRERAAQQVASLPASSSQATPPSQPANAPNDDEPTVIPLSPEVPNSASPAQDLEADSTINSIATIVPDSVSTPTRPAATASTTTTSPLSPSTSSIISTNSTSPTTAPTTTAATPAADESIHASAQAVAYTPAPQHHQQSLERLRVVIYKRAPFIFSAFYDPKVADKVLSSEDYYKALHLRLGTLVEPIFEDLEKSG
ncbi:uncharacterized protein V1518DRAFT_420481 [Limtongia smithiae]|uniref:uncharacterized protein n=1 Tax=Limtongia smithiae TaxID=1125753 RepID=UPI0034CF5D16